MRRLCGAAKKIRKEGRQRAKRRAKDKPRLGESCRNIEAVIRRSLKGIERNPGWYSSPRGYIRDCTNSRGLEEYLEKKELLFKGEGPRQSKENWKRAIE